MALLNALLPKGHLVGNGDPLASSRARERPAGDGAVRSQYSHGFTARLFCHGQKGNVNVRGAYLHMLTDMLVPFVVVIGGAVVCSTGWWRVAPAIAFSPLGVIAYGPWGLLRETLQLSLNAIPAGLDLAAVQVALLALPVTQDDLHVWSLSTPTRS